MDEAHKSSDGLMGLLRRLLDTGLSLAENRLELLSVELQEEKHRLVEILILTFITVALGLVSMIVVSLAILVLFWENGRLPVLLILTTLYVAATICMYFKLQACIRAGQPPFHTSAGELKKDRECLQPKH